MILLKQSNEDNYLTFIKLFLTSTWFSRRDGDVTYTYNTMYKIASEVKEKNTSLEEVMKNKEHLATWFVTNCGYTAGAKTRFSLVQKLVDLGLDVDRRLFEVFFHF